MMARQVARYFPSHSGTYQLTTMADIRNFGAALDGTTDDLPAINDAKAEFGIAYIPTLTGTTPMRTEVLIDGELRIGSYERVICAGRLLTTLVLANTSSRVMFPGRHARLYNCTIDATAASTGIYFGEDPYNTDTSRVSNWAIDVHLLGPGRDVAGSIGVHFGETDSNFANYYNYMVRPWIQDFETIAKFHQHANANKLVSPHCTGYWIGVSLDCAESTIEEPTFVDSPGTRIADGDAEDRDSVCLDVLANAKLNQAIGVAAEPRQYSKGVRTDAAITSGNYFQGSWNIALGHDVNDSFTSLVTTAGGGEFLAERFRARGRYTLGPDDAVEQCTGTGSPEGAVTAPPGSLYQQQDGNGEVWRKRSGTGNTGWAGMDRVGARVYPSAEQAIPDSTWTKLTHDTTDADPNGLFSDANDRIAANRNGWWLVTASAEWFINSTGRRLIALAQGGGRIRVNAVEAIGAERTRLSVSDVVYVTNASTYFEVEVWQDSGGSLEVGSGDLGTWLSAVFLGA